MALTKSQSIVSWVLQVTAAVILLQTLFFKFTGAAESVYMNRDAPEAQKGFLMNHLIHELLPSREDGRRWSNSDPITGQAAWYDLRVRIEKADKGAVSEPHFSTLAEPGKARAHPTELRYGQEWAS